MDKTMISNIITHCNGRNKVIDFRDNLNVAYEHEYTRMHGIGGKKHGYKSVVKCTLCDYSNGTGENSVTVDANIELDTIYLLLDIVRDRLINGNNTPDVQLLTSIKNELKILYRNVQDSNFKNQIATIGQDIQKVIPDTSKPDFEYSQERVDQYHMNTKDGTAPVTFLRINRQGIRQNGEISKYPWYIEITEGVAPVKTQPNGTVNYVAQKLQVEKKASINIDDKNLYRMMLRITRYIETWENTVCIPLMRSGIKALREQRSN